MLKSYNFKIKFICLYLILNLQRQDKLKLKDVHYILEKTILRNPKKVLIMQIIQTAQK